MTVEGNAVDKDLFESRFLLLDDQYKSFIELSDQLREMTIDLELDEEEAPQLKAFDKVEGYYHEIRAVARRVLIREVSAASNRASSNESDDRTMNLHYSMVLLGTCLVLAKNKSGTFIPIRALIDPASQASFITTDCQQRLGIPRRSSLVNCFGLAATPITSTKGTASVVIRPRRRGPELQVNAIVIPKISSTQPTEQVPDRVRHHFEFLELADPEYYEPGPVDILLGADMFSDIMLDKPVVRSSGLPTAWPSIFGYVLIGPLNSVSSATHDSSNISTCLVSSESDLDLTLQKFWRLEEAPMVHIVSPQDELAKEMFVNCHYRKPSGRYVVPLLLKEIYCLAALGDSQTTAIRRYKLLERKLNENPQGRDEYNSILSEYISLGHMSQVGWGTGKYYVPHHAVYKECSTTSRVRVVFDASNKTTTGTSLNDMLLVGPKLHQDISALIIRFRLHKVALIGDICKMYRMIELRPEERAYQHIIWRPNSDSDLQEYELNTVTFGLASSPYLAMRTIKQLCIDEALRYPCAADVVSRDLFVDDLVTGTASPQKAKSLITEINNLMNAGGFQVRKWASNLVEVLQELPSDLCQIEVNFNYDQVPSIKLLGIYWEAKSDTFCYHVRQWETPNTKRGILSTIARIFDPLGWIAPIVFWAKYLMQNLWKLKPGWDDELPSSTLKLWKEFVKQLPSLVAVKIPRWIGKDTTLNIECYISQILGFCDASERGYCASVYVRMGDLAEKGTVHLVLSKTRVAPIKTQSIPRLELLGAVLLSKLIKFVFDCISGMVKITRVFAWTDSSTVLTWLDTPPHRLKTFVAHRIMQIKENAIGITWNHIKTQDNAADIGSRGCLPSELVYQHLWWHGPTWLSEPFVNWKISSFQPIEFNQLSESKHIVDSAFTVQLARSFVVSSYFTKHS
ncbi:uncharacterized protein LOC124171219 [Ischnura elegans]|uniref:uncharacterized protein LOC124171218 n=1 Tax=Ischnura elegans TaxID=197161 RepID=UPI001ED8816B|nr:uncharacterized protein LOC124171218 [Ischnura elegans]XP_046406318.1 uncharacterized protein LOC124171219 [Ischnura elegans]